ncbi:MAG: hypothetical protein IPJ30_19840 [Acidobacteria bacterium]|nr:hypothetical protein [Acidobacteriota bacterium]
MENFVTVFDAQLTAGRSIGRRTRRLWKTAFGLTEKISHNSKKGFPDVTFRDAKHKKNTNMPKFNGSGPVAGTDRIHTPSCDQTAKGRSR